jgi:photosystem II stability/assembly factor-like uncharacterized protein
MQLRSYAILLLFVVLIVAVFSTTMTPISGLVNSKHEQYDDMIRPSPSEFDAYDSLYNDVSYVWTAEYGGFTFIEDISILSDDNIWAVGSHIIHFDGRVWVAVDPWPNSRRLTGIDMISPEEGWAVGGDGLIIRYNDDQWKLAESIDSVEFQSVDMLSARSGWAVGYHQSSNEGVVYRFDGVNWVKVDVGIIGRLNDIDMISPEEGWAVGNGGTILHFALGQWRPVETDIDGDIYSVDSLSNSDVWAVGGRESFSGSPRQLIIHYDGSRWTNTIDGPGPTLYSVSMDSNTGWAVGWGGNVWRYDNNAWSQFQRIALNRSYASLRAVASSRYGATTSGDTGMIVRLNHDDWVVAHGARKLSGIKMFESNVGWAVGCCGQQLHFTKGEWNVISGPEELARLVDIDGITEDNIWGIGGSGLIMHFNGNSWMVVKSPTDTNLLDIRVVSETNAWATGYKLDPVAGSSAVVIHYDGTEWKVVYKDTDEPIQPLRGIDVVDESDVWVVGEQVILHFDGDVWKVDNVEAKLHSISMISRDAGWAGGDRVILQYDGHNWNRSLGEDDLRSGRIIYKIRVDGDQTWAIGSQGIVLRFEEAGWRFVRSPGTTSPDGTPHALLDIDILNRDNGDRVFYTVGDPETILKLIENNSSPTATRISITPIPTISTTPEPTGIPKNVRYIPMLYLSRVGGLTPIRERKAGSSSGARKVPREEIAAR